jgi:arginyl-tRNA synthetase
VYLEAQKRLGVRLRQLLKDNYDLEIANIAIEIPPDLQFGELATPVAFELARKLRKAPKIIATEIVAAIGPLPGFASFEVAGAGYINARLDRAAGVRAVAGVAVSQVPKCEGPGAPSFSGVSDSPAPAVVPTQEHSLVEHTSINPNKAAHIGHLRNAILGDTFVRVLRAAGQKVDVQNYIDNTGVQVADVVVGFLHLEGKSVAEVQAIIADCEARTAAATDKSAAFDYLCWDVYARTSQWYTGGNDEENAARKKLRYDTLHAIEHGGNETAEIAELISTAVLRRHLETMLRLGIEYDFLPRESEILHLNFWALAFEQLKQTGVLYFETEGKNKGCWVMTRPGFVAEESENEDGTKATNEDAKVIVRSNGTVTYVGKDIAYHLWKFGLLGKDFGYKPFFEYADRECWISTEQGVEPHPHFGGANAIYNVIDSRQSDPQANVIQALRGMGHVDQANRYTHFSYEMVALTPRCAVELGYSVSEEDQKKAYIEVSGRKGFGVKADDLIDKLIAATRAEVDSRQTGGASDQAEAERQKIAHQIAIGALRYFMLKFSRNSVIAFDFKDALSFEGETGPYCQYAVVRIRNIFRKAGTTPEAVLAEFAGLAGLAEFGPYLAGEENLAIWSLWLRAARRSMVLEQCITTSEPACLAKHAFQLAQEFSNFYHHHHILNEEDPAKKVFLLATAAVALRELVEMLSWLGIESPEAM